MGKTKFINVVSGKGGTGKTLLCTILADLLGNQNISVLVIDMDIFVRGLTALLYFHKGESLRLVNDQDDMTVSDFFNMERKESIKNMPNLAIHKYRSFDIVPAVSRIDQMFEIEEEMYFEGKRNHMVFHMIRDSIPLEKYDYVLFDCRAGYDSLVSTIHRKSDITICVQEEDDISEITANNLISQLERESSRKFIFKLVNKARNIKTFEELERKQKKGITSIGYIPFDMDVMNSFGENSFWDDISRTLYKAAVSEAWNKLASKAELPHKLYYKRYSPLISEKMERSFGIIGQKDRMVAFMGLLLAIMGLLYFSLGKGLVFYLAERPDMLISILISIMGTVMFLFSFFRKPKRDR